MASPIDSLIETLTETRAKLDEQLGRNEAYRALRQLEQRETSGERLSIVSADRLRQALEAELGTDSTFQTRRKIDESLAMLGAWAKAGIVLPPVEAERPAAEPEVVSHPQAYEASPQAIAEPPDPAEPPTTPVAMAEPLTALPESAQDAAALPSDDLSLVRDLPVACISVITAAGYGRYEALAAIDSAGVALLERLLGQRGIVSRGNWIEQAALLAQGRETQYAARLIALRTGSEWPPQPQSPEIIAQPPALEPLAPSVAVAPVEPAPAPVPEQPTVAPVGPRLAEPNDLTHIAGIDRTLADRLAADGATFAWMAAWTSKDLASVSVALSIPAARIAQEGWIEQAALLSTGRVTRYLAAKPLAVPLAALPPLVEIPLDEEPEAVAEAASEIKVVAGPASALSDAPIVVPAAANDDPPPPPPDDSAPPVPPAIWPAAAAKAAILRPLRKPADRGDKAFDDVAALVAQTVATARNVGGRSERPDRPPPVQSPPDVPVQAEPARPAAVAKPAVASAATLRAEPSHPAAPAKPSPQVAASSPESPAIRVPPRTPAPPAATAAPVQPPRIAPPAVAPETDRPPSRMRAASTDPEASIEIRPRAAAAPSVPAAAQRHSNGSARAPAPGLADSARASRLEGPAKTLVATARAGGSAESGSPPRRVVVIDEIARPAPLAPSGDPPASSVLPMAARAGGLFQRLVKALKGDTPD